MLSAGFMLGAPVWYWVAGTATGAYANACRLDPENRDAALGYAEALTRSSDPEDNRRGAGAAAPAGAATTDIRVLSPYAFSAFEQQRFGEAVAASGDDAGNCCRRVTPGGR